MTFFKFTPVDEKGIGSQDWFVPRINPGHLKGVKRPTVTAQSAVTVATQASIFMKSPGEFRVQAFH
jgi:hypothetical protein